MKLILLFSFIFCLTNNVISQSDSISAKLPDGMNQGMIVYINKFDTSYTLVFKSEDYLFYERKNFINEEQSEATNVDSLWNILKDTLVFAQNKAVTVLNHKFIPFFPNNCVLSKLFRQNKVLVFKKINGCYYEVKFKVHVKRDLQFGIHQSIIMLTVFDSKNEFFFGSNCCGYDQVQVDFRRRRK